MEISDHYLMKSSLYSTSRAIMQIFHMVGSKQKLVASKLSSVRQQICEIICAKKRSIVGNEALL